MPIDRTELSDMLNSLQQQAHHQRTPHEVRLSTLLTHPARFRERSLWQQKPRDTIDASVSLLSLSKFNTRSDGQPAVKANRPRSVICGKHA